jgi:hypothetical protein
MPAPPPADSADAVTERLTLEDNRVALALYGERNANLKLIERETGAHADAPAQARGEPPAVADHQRDRFVSIQCMGTDQPGAVPRDVADEDALPGCEGVQLGW